MTIKQPQIMMEEVRDPVELEQARAQDTRFARNWTWFEAHTKEIYATHRGKCVCIAGEELFVADTPEEALAMATALILMMMAVLRVSYPSKGWPGFMLISGVWHACDDGVLRPVIPAEIQAQDGSWIKAPCLVGTGADRTVLSVDVLAALRVPHVVAEDRIGGIGGVVTSILIETQMRLSRENDGKVIFRGQYAAVTEAATLDMSVLGRDITNLFATLVDWPQRAVYLIGQRHQYAITQQASQGA